MIIKSHVRGGFRAAADYLKDQGENEKVRLIEISDPDATNLDEAFQNMWAVASHSRAKKPLHHISINPYKDERLTIKQVKKIARRCEEKYGYAKGDHQRVIVEHVKGRQHFHVMWNRVSLTSGKAVWPGLHWKKSKQAAREMEAELGLKRPIPKRMKLARRMAFKAGRKSKISGRYAGLDSSKAISTSTPTQTGSSKSSKGQPQDIIRKITAISVLPVRQAFRLAMRKMFARRPKHSRDENIPDSEKMDFRRPEWDSAATIAWAIENGHLDVLAQYGFDFTPDMAEP